MRVRPNERVFAIVILATLIVLFWRYGFNPAQWAK
jgi:hypothetical protein